MVSREPPCICGVNMRDSISVAICKYHVDACEYLRMKYKERAVDRFTDIRPSPVTKHEEKSLNRSKQLLQFNHHPSIHTEIVLVYRSSFIGTNSSSESIHQHFLLICSLG